MPPDGFRVFLARIGNRLDTGFYSISAMVRGFVKVSAFCEQIETQKRAAVLERLRNRRRSIMGFYSNHIFPHLMDRALSRPEVKRMRKEALAYVAGEILEIGFGTGLNLECYPGSVEEITAVDPNFHMMRLASQRIKNSRIRVDFHMLGTEKMPFPSESFDTVVSTWTLCSIPEVHPALAEVHRVLKKNGRFVFLEHGRSPDKSIHFWQRMFRPLFKAGGAGCHLDREVNSLIEGQRFVFERLKCFYLEATPRIAGFVYTGVAVKRL